jgi:hypothetical protein
MIKLFGSIVRALFVVSTDTSDVVETYSAVNSTFVSRDAFFFSSTSTTAVLAVLEATEENDAAAALASTSRSDSDLPPPTLATTINTTAIPIPKTASLQQHTPGLRFCFCSSSFSSCLSTSKAETAAAAAADDDDAT